MDDPYTLYNQGRGPSLNRLAGLYGSYQPVASSRLPEAHCANGLAHHNDILRYESSTLILDKELSSSIFQSLSVSESGIDNTCPDLQFVPYIKA